MLNTESGTPNKEIIDYRPIPPEVVPISPKKEEKMPPKLGDHTGNKRYEPIDEHGHPIKQ